jgi:hypothetical protein
MREVLQDVVGHQICQGQRLQQSVTHLPRASL